VTAGQKSTAKASSVRNAGQQTVIVRIPGSIKKSPIEFTPSLNLVPVTAELVNKPPDNIQGNSGDSRNGVILMPSGKGSAWTAAWYVLASPEQITAIGTPIPLEAEIIVNRTSPPFQAGVGEIVPDSVAAWKRLKTWPELKKGIPGKVLTQIDTDANEVQQSVQKVFEEGRLDQIKTEELLKKYESFGRDLGEAFDRTTNFDVMRQLSTEILGVRAERLAWSQAVARKPSVLNPKYSAYFKDASAEVASPKVPAATSHPKATSEIGGVGMENTYAGYEQLQALYPTSRYKNMYQQARATVAICENEQAFATGTIVGKNLILTCAHAVARTGRGGKPLARDPKKLRVRVGYEFPDDPNTPPDSIPAKIVFEGNIAEKSGEPLDFVLLRAEIGNYETRCFDRAQMLADGIRWSQKSNEQKMREIKDSAFWPIEPLSLAAYEISEATSFDIAGHPEGRAKLICNHGKVLYPPRMSVSDRDDLKRTLTKDAKTLQEKKTLEDRFNQMYDDRKNGDGSTYYQFVYGNNSPGIGVICSTVNGNSGGAAIDDSSNPACIIGILVEGQSGNSIPWTPGMEYHETLLPIAAIIHQLDDMFKAEKTGNREGPRFQERWDKHYQVSVMERGDDGTLVQRQ
jgi:hypothetical protein